jgi:hypothetical protein
MLSFLTVTKKNRIKIMLYFSLLSRYYGNDARIKAILMQENALNFVLKLNIYNL